MTSAVVFSHSLKSLMLAGAVCLGGVRGIAEGSVSEVRQAAGIHHARTDGHVTAVARTRLRPTTVHGTAWRPDNTPIAGARLRLRNVVSGKIDATTIADGTGQFTFADVPEGTYLVELVNTAGKVLVVGHTFTIGLGETVATFVRLGPRVPWFNGFFGNVAHAVSAGAASTGITAVAPDAITSVSPNR